MSGKLLEGDLVYICGADKLNAYAFTRDGSWGWITGVMSSDGEDRYVLCWGRIACTEGLDPVWMRVSETWGIDPQFMRKLDNPPATSVEVTKLVDVLLEFDGALAS